MHSGSEGNFLITGGTFVAYVNENKDFDFPLSRIASGAFHDSGDRFDSPRCHPRTRSVLLAEIMNWVTGESRTSFIMWLYGPAGAGKTALAQSIAEICDSKGLLAASFFFSKESPERNHAKRLASTISYQIALSFPDTRPYIEDAIRRDLSIFDRALKTQVQRLITDPIRKSAAICRNDTVPTARTPPLIIIDALDECMDPKVHRYILDIIDEEYRSQESLPLIFIITSRPDEAIRMRFAAGNLSRLTLQMSLEDYFESRSDIQTYLQLKFQEIKEEHPFRAYIPASWPSDEITDILLTKSSGQFVYATTVMDYISSLHHRPTDRLDIVLGLLKHDGDPPFSELDALFGHILSSIFNVNLQQALRILGAILLISTPFSPEVVESLLFLRPGDVPMYLGGLTSLINFNDPHRKIKVLHASLSDYLFDEDRAGRFYVSRDIVHADIAKCCLRHLKSPHASEKSILVDYACYNFETHLDAAAPTNELREELLYFRIATFYRGAVRLSKIESYEADSTVTLEDIWYFIPTFFDCIRNSVLYNDSDEIYEHQLNFLDDFLEAEFDKYAVDDRLMDLVTLVSIYSSPISIGNLDDIPLIKDSLLELKNAEHLIMIDENSLNLRNMVRRHSQNEPFIELLCEFLEDSDRSGRHFLTATRFTKAAFRCLKWTNTRLRENGGTKTLSPLIWVFECIPTLLLYASHDNDLKSLLESFQLPPIKDSSGFHHKILRNMEESRLAYIIEGTFNNNSLRTVSLEHNHDLHIAPQGLKIYQTGVWGGAKDVFERFEDEWENLHREFCCVNALLAGYVNSQKKDHFRNLDRGATARLSIILPVVDPFPEIAGEPENSDDELRKGTVTAVMNILIYRSWRKLLYVLVQCE